MGDDWDFTELFRVLLNDALFLSTTLSLSSVLSVFTKVGCASSLFLDLKLSKFCSVVLARWSPDDPKTEESTLIFSLVMAPLVFVIMATSSFLVAMVTLSLDGGGGFVILSLEGGGGFVILSLDGGGGLVILSLDGGGGLVILSLDGGSDFAGI